LIILVIFIVLAGMAIIGGTVFRVRNIKIVPISFSSLDITAVNNKLQPHLDYLNGKNILFNTDKDAIKKIVEDNEIFLKVVNIKAEFPNTIVIDVRERYPVYLYKGAGKTFVLDAEMRVLYIDSYPTERESDLSDISLVDSGILFNTSITEGDYIVGVGEINKEKIELVNIIPQFFASNGSYEASIIHQIRGITFDPTIDGIIMMNVKVQPENHEAIDVTLKIMKAPEEDFAELFACVWATMERQIQHTAGTKVQGQAGTYTVYYSLVGQLEVLFNGTNPDGRPYDAKFVSNGGQISEE
jgi:hypothetical protein